MRRFIEAAASEHLAGGEPLIELYALSVGDIIVATFGGIVGGGRFCGMFNSIIKDRYAAESPGEQLLAHVVRRCCERGLDTFDLGIGEANYKTLFCSDAEPLFDSYLPLSRGRTAARAGFGIAARGKRTIKGHAALWSPVRLMRRLRARLSRSRSELKPRRPAAPPASSATSAKPAIISRSRAARVAGLAGSPVTSTACCASGAKRSTATSAAEPASITT